MRHTQKYSCFSKVARLHTAMPVECQLTVLSCIWFQQYCEQYSQEEYSDSNYNWNRCPCHKIPSFVCCTERETARHCNHMTLSLHMYGLGFGKATDHPYLCLGEQVHCFQDRFPHQQNLDHVLKWLWMCWDGVLLNLTV